MDAKRKNEIRGIAKRINDESEKYQLAHACQATEHILRNDTKEHYRPKHDDIVARLKNETDPEKIKGIRKELEELKKKVAAPNIKIDYLEHLSWGSARAYRINGTIRISLPRDMTCLRKESGELDIGRMRALRELMAHELGHVILHNKHANMKAGLQGTHEFGGEHEEEANFFGSELLEMRRKRNDELYKDGNYRKI